MPNFLDVTPCGCCKNRRFGGKYRLHHQGVKNQQARNNVTIVTANIPCSITFHPEGGGDTFPRNVSSYNSHMAYHPGRRTFFSHRHQNLKC
jgi:hypothetical protein